MERLNKLMNIKYIEKPLACAQLFCQLSLPVLLGSGVLASWAHLGEAAIEDYPGLGT